MLAGATTKIYYYKNWYTLRKYIEKMADDTRDLCVCGFHVYCVIWEANLGEVFDWYRTTRITLSVRPVGLGIPIPTRIAAFNLDPHLGYISEPLVSLIIKQSPHYSEHTIAVQKATKATCELTIGLLHKKRLRPRGHNCPNHNNSEWTWWVRRELPAGWLLYLFRSSGSPSTSRPLEMHCVSGTDGSLRDFHHTVHVVRLKPQSYT